MAENKITFQIDTSSAADWTPYEGLGASDLFPKDGAYEFAFEKIVTDLSGDDKTPAAQRKPMLVVVLVAQDEDAKGLRVVHNILCGGLDKNNKPLVKQLWDALHAAGVPAENVKALAAQKVIPVEAVIAEFMKRRIYADCEAEAYQNKLSTKVKNFITKDRYETMKTGNAHRRPHRVSQPLTAAPPNGFVPQGANVPQGLGAGIPQTGLSLGGAPTAAAPTTSFANGLAAPIPAGGVDPLKQMTGLGLG